MKKSKKQIILLMMIVIIITIILIVFCNNKQVIEIADTKNIEKKATITGVSDNRFTYSIIPSNPSSIYLESYIGTDTDVIIPSNIDGYTVVSMSEKVIYNNNEVKIVNLTIPSTLNGIIVSNVANTSKLKNIYVQGGNEKFISKDGILFSKDGTELIIYPGGREATTYNIPNGVKTIKTSAFAFCKNLTNITIPNTVTTIEDSAFRDSNLESITIPDSVTTLNSGVFSDCKKLQSIVLPKGINKINDWMFTGCDSLEELTIPNTVTEIGSGSFAFCKNLTITVPNSVTKISESAFGGGNWQEVKNVKCNRDSYVYEYISKKGINFTLLDLRSISITKPITKTNYVQGFENLDLTGGELTLTYNDNSTEIIRMTVPGVKTSGFDNSSTGTKVVTVSYGGKTTTLSVTVNARVLTGIKVKTSPTKVSYIQSFENLDLAGGKLTLIYNDNNTWTEELSMKSTGVIASGFSNSTVGTVPVTISYRGKTTILNVTVVAKTLTGISLKTFPTKMNYIQNFENLDLAGGKLKLIYNNNNAWTEEVSMLDSGVTTSGFSNSIVGTVPVTISYGGKTTRLNVTVEEKVLTGIKVKTSPTKVSYIQSFENLDLTGGKLTLIYNDNNAWTEELSMVEEGVTTSGFSNSTVGTVPVTIIYRGKTTILNITVETKILTGISVKTYPTKVSYVQNFENLDLTGGELTLIYNNNNNYTDKVSMKAEGVTTSGFNNSTVGTVSVTISYGGKTTRLNVTIEEKVLTGISVKTSPTKTSYIQNFENLDLTGGKLKLIYNNNNAWTEELSMEDTGVTASGFSNSAVGTVSVTISYKEKTTTMEVTIEEKTLTGINVKTPPTKLSYIQNFENLDLTGGMLTLTYNDNNAWTEELSMENTGVTASGFSNSEVGTVSVTISYKEKTTTMEVTIEEKTLTGISVKTSPTKISYIQNFEELDLTGGKLTLTYNDNNAWTEELSMEDTGVTASGFSNSEVGTVSVTISYKEKTTTMEVTIEEKTLTGISVKTSPTKISYIQNFENLDLTGGKLTLIYNDNNAWTEELSMLDSEVRTSGFSNSEVGTVSVTIIYKGKTTTMDVAIEEKTLTGISVKALPTKVSYIQNFENLDLTGGKLTLIYNDNNAWTEELSMLDSEISTSGFSNSEVGTVSVTISYKEKTTTMDVTIEEKTLTGISVKTLPTKVSYIQNFENLDLTGGMLTLTYNDNNAWTEELSMLDSGVTTNGFSNSTVGKVAVTIIYKEKTTTIDVTIEAKTLTGISIKNPPIKINYVQNFENLDLTGGELTLSYNDNSTEMISMKAEGVTTSGFNNSIVGTVEVIISYKEKTTTMDVTVEAKVLTGIAVKTPLTKMSYIQNFENLDLTGGKLSLIYNDNNAWTEELSMLDTGVTTSGFNNTTVGIVPVTISYGGKTAIIDVIVEEKTLTGISVKTPPTKMSYIQNFENLDLTGGKLTLTYNDNNAWTEELSMEDTGVTASGFSNSEIGIVPVTISYEGKDTILNVTVKEKILSGIKVKTPPTKVNYVQKFEDLDLTGGKLILTYNDNNAWIEELSMTDRRVTASGFSNSEVGTVLVTLNYEGKKTTIDVTIEEKVLTGISVKRTPTKISYIQDFEDIDLTGGKLALIYNDNNAWTEEVSMLDSGVTASGFSNITVGIVPVTISYKGKTTTLNVTVEEKTLTGISIKTPPTKMRYVQNSENLDLKGGKLTLLYNNNSDWTEEINMTDSGVTASGFTNITVGRVPVIISYKGKEAILNVIIEEKTLKEISVTTNPIKLAYIQDFEDLDLTGGEITLSYNDNSTEIISMLDSGVVVSGFSNSTVGRVAVTISYEGKKTTIDVTVEAKVLTGISVKNPPTKASYVQGFENLDLAGGKLTLTYNNNNAWTEELSMTDERVIASGFSNSTVGIIPVTISFEGKITTIDVIVEEKTLTGITVKELPKKVSYLQNFEDLDLTGGRLTLIYNNNKDWTEEVDMLDSGVTASGFNNNTVGRVPVTISYNGKETILNVIIEERTLREISVKTPPTKMSYIQDFEDLDLTGGEITLSYNNNSTETISMKATGVTASGFSNSTVGKIPITISYNEKTTTIDVTVEAKVLTGISVKTPPTKMNYLQNSEDLDLTGGKLTLIYNNNNAWTEEINMINARVTASGFSNSTVGTVPVTLSYEGKTTILNVTIEGKNISEIGDIKYQPSTEGNGIIITGVDNDNPNIVIPDKIDGKIVIGIGDNVFANRDNLISVEIPNTVTQISNNAFEGSNNVTIICNKGFTAEQYAKGKDINYIFKDKNIREISVQTKPKSTYNKGENLNLAGGRILLIYTDGDTSLISMIFPGVSVTGYNNIQVGKQNLKVTFREKITSFEVTIEETQGKPSGLKGDITGDGVVDITDLLLLRRHIIAGSTVQWILTGDVFISADMNSDNIINLTDLLLLKRKIVSN